MGHVGWPKSKLPVAGGVRPERDWFHFYRIEGGGAAGLGCEVRKDGALVHMCMREVVLFQVFFIKTRSSGTASGTCFGQQEEKQKQNRAESQRTADKCRAQSDHREGGGPLKGSLSSSPLTFNERCPRSLSLKVHAVRQGGHAQQRWRRMKHHTEDRSVALGAKRSTPVSPGGAHRGTGVLLRGRWHCRPRPQGPHGGSRPLAV